MLMFLFVLFLFSLIKALLSLLQTEITHLTMVFNASPRRLSALPPFWKNSCFGRLERPLRRQSAPISP
jgi:hypothetical protein